MVFTETQNTYMEVVYANRLLMARSFLARKLFITGYSSSNGDVADSLDNLF